MIKWVKVQIPVNTFENLNLNTQDHIKARFRTRSPCSLTWDGRQKQQNFHSSDSTYPDTHRRKKKNIMETLSQTTW